MCLHDGNWTEEEISEHNSNITPGELVMVTWTGSEANMYDLLIKWGKEMPCNDMRYTVESAGIPVPDTYIPTQITKLGEWTTELEPGDRIVRAADMEIRIDRD